MTAANAQLIEAHLSRLTLGGYRPRSIGARRICLRGFAATLEPRGLPDATRLDVEAFLGREGLKPESRRAYLGHLRGFYGWAVEEEYMPVNPTAKVRPIRVPAAAPRPVSEDALVLALAAADARMRAWLLLMALGGLRSLEVAALRPEDLIVAGEETLLYLRECKGGGTAHVPAHPLILRALAEVPIRQEGTGARAGERLWWTCGAHRVSVLTTAHLRSVGINATAHALRHFAGTSWYRASGHDLLATAALMRHKNVKTTMIYAQLDPTRGASVVRSVELAGLGSSVPDGTDEDTVSTAPSGAVARSRSTVELTESAAPALRIVRDAS